MFGKREAMYTKESIFSDLMEVPASRELMEKFMPGMADSGALKFVKGMSVERVMENMPEKKRLMFQMLIDVANGKEVSFMEWDLAEGSPEIEEDGEFSYDIDDVDGSMYMLEHRFSGCLIVKFSKRMDEAVYGKVTCNGEVLPQGLVKTIKTAGNMQMCGIPVRKLLAEYDTVYELIVEGFQDMNGNVMKPQTIAVHTLPKPISDLSYEAHDEVALRAAEEGIVLLKNENHLLPLKSDEEVCLWGAEQFRTGTVGAGRINPRYSIGLKRGIAEYSCLELSEKADTGIIVISRPSGENFDNKAVKGEFYLSESEEESIATLCGACSHVIAVINSGYPMDLRWLEAYKIEAALWCGYPGMLGGKAVAEILDGRINPSGKLPDTWSLDYWDIPASANFYQPKSGEAALDADSMLYVDTYYEEDIYVGYRYFETFEKPVAYPFGYGLSYTSFAAETKMEEEQIIVHIENTGTVDGREVVQVYARIPDGRLEQPAKRLIAFSKTRQLKPGEKEVIQLEVEEHMLTSFEEETASWIMETGKYEFFVGNSVKNLEVCGELYVKEKRVLKTSINLLQRPVEIKTLSKRGGNFPKGEKSGVKEHVTKLEPRAIRKSFLEKPSEEADFIDDLSVRELARLSVCASSGWGMQEKGEAGKIYQLEVHDMPSYAVADGNNGVNIRKPNIGMPCSNTICATWNTQIAYELGQAIAEEAKENGVQMILAPAMNIHRNPLNGRHPEYFSEDPYLAGMMAGNQSKGLEDQGVSSCIKHVIANNCESSRKRNQSLMTERAMREIYLKVFEIALSVHQPDSMMTAYNAVNGCFTAEDEELIQGIFRNEFGFKGFVMTDWNSYDTADVVAAVQAGNSWLTPGTNDDTFVTPIVEGVKLGKISLERLRSNVRYMLRVVQRRTGKGLGVK